MRTESSSKVFAGDGRPLTLDRAVKSGGAGSIHQIVGISDLVAKIYHPDVDHGIYERKVEAMLSFVPDLPDIAEGGVREVQIAWPRFLLRDGQRRFVGFTMPLLDFATSVEVECVLQERQARAQGLPTGLGAKVTLAANLASLIAELHRLGHYVVDLKPVNLRFYRRSLHVAMLDCDGYSIKGDGERFSAPQFTPEYLAPEFQRPGLSAGGDLASNEQSQDRFALAVVIFQLLNFGIHPFTGRPASERLPTDIPGRIAHRCYAYGLRANPEMAPNPASGHSAMPLELRQLFDRAFTAKGLSRPSADDWVTRLHAYGRRSTGLLVSCRADGSHQHFAGLPCGACARKALLTRAASVVRTPARKAPAWTPRRAAPPVRIGRLPTARLSAPLPPAAFPVPGLPQSTRPSWAAKPWNAVAFFFPIVVALISFIYFSVSRPSRRQIARATETRQEKRARERLTPATTLDDVLKAARIYSEEVIVQELSRLPSSLQKPNQARCRAAVAAWDQTMRWIKDDPSYARALIRVEPQREPCEDLDVLVPRIVRAQALCREMLYSPGAYSGIGESECEKNRVNQAGLETLQDALVWGNALRPLVWQGLAQAFLLSDDDDKALAAFVVSALVARRIGVGGSEGFVSAMTENWFYERAAILNARAWARVHQWHDEPIPDQIDVWRRAPWPEQPPPKKPKQQRARR